MNREQLRERYRAVRSFTERLCAPLSTEDYVVQSMPDVSPTKWHLGHTSWFFETFVLRLALAGYRPLEERYAYLFNSYYHAAGERHPQPQRGLLSRPTVAEVYAYRQHVDQAIERWLDEAAESVLAAHAFVFEVGLHHEEQHQELILTDIKHVLAQNPLEPTYRAGRERPRGAAAPLEWVALGGGLVEVGHTGEGFSFDNEGPRHPVYLRPFALGHRLVTVGEYLAFMGDGGYERPELWLSDGWEARRRHDWEAPLYWRRMGEGSGVGERSAWRVVTLAGARALDEHEPACHVSHYEADAYARWAGARLPLEEEWEAAAEGAPRAGNFAESELFHPAPLQRRPAPGSVAQLLGDVWEWTASPYLPYPGYRPFTGALGEYNGKFMSGRMVLRGGSCATPEGHIRPSYRNFFAPEARWQFSGIRLARWVD